MLEDMVVNVWRLQASGREDEARWRLLHIWRAMMDGGADPRTSRVVHRLLVRLGFSTDAPSEWAALPDPLIVYRAGPPGFAWSTDESFVQHLADGDEIRTATVRKADVVAFIIGYGESEVVLRHPL